MSAAAALAVLVVLTAGGIMHQVQETRTHAVIYCHDGHIEQVQVVNHGHHFCPVDCQVNHRHRVHDVRWVCPDGEACTHYTVLHVVYRGEENRLAALERALREAGLDDAGGTMTLAAKQEQ